MSPDVTGHVGRTGGVGCPRELLIRWQPLRRDRGGWPGAPDSPCGFL